MTLPKKKSRCIRVNNIDFRYIISTSLIDNDRNFELNVTIQVAEGKGAALSIKSLFTRDFWLDSSDSTRGLDDYPVILPNHIERFIKKGIEEGWNPQSRGSEFSLKLENKSVFE